jgi:RHS repeat-associated protein
VSLSINPANNRINSSGYTYDNNGNLTAMPGSTFVYDIENRMVQVTSSGSEYYGYDPSNRRVWKTTTTDGAGKIFFYGAMGELMGTFSCAAGCTTDPPAKVETNLHFAGRLIRWDNGAVVLDRLGGVVKRSNIYASPQISQTSAYYPFGEERTATGQDRTKFATYYRDNKTSFDYAMNRYYNNSWGRFTTPDPYGPSASPGNPLSWNRYAYVVNDPVNKNDPEGLDPEMILRSPIMAPRIGGSGASLLACAGILRV